VPVRHSRSRNSALAWAGRARVCLLSRSSLSGPHVTVRPDPPIARSLPTLTIPSVPGPSHPLPPRAASDSRRAASRTRGSCSASLLVFAQYRSSALSHGSSGRANSGLIGFRPSAVARRPNRDRPSQVITSGVAAPCPAGVGHHSRGGQRASGHAAALRRNRQSPARQITPQIPRPRPSARHDRKPAALLLCQSAPLIGRGRHL
jgi:hypothetical protein